jgi:hypothetical protein
LPPNVQAGTLDTRVYVPAGFTDTLIYGEDIEFVPAAFVTTGSPIVIVKSRKTAKNHLIA